jgi:hypothetical protein
MNGVVMVSDRDVIGEWLARDGDAFFQQDCGLAMGKGIAFDGVRRKFPLIKTTSY